MKQGKLDQMSAVTQAVYMNEFQKIKGILAEEARLRAALEKLRTQSAEGRETLQREQSMQTVGADLLWQAWLNRTQRQLNIELAQVMARKLTAMDRVRRAFGKQTAVQSMLDAQNEDSKQAARKKAIETLLNRHVQN